MTGTLYGIGVGPGDPELMTLKAHRLISTARVVAYPARTTAKASRGASRPPRSRATLRKSP